MIHEINASAIIACLAAQSKGNKVKISIKKVIDKVTKKEEVKKITIVDPDSKTRPYAVMINNLGVARPYQSGLQDAYMIYEFIVEGGITRYLALFKDVNVDRIGTIRSSRHYYLDYVLENDAIYVHWGGSEFAYNDIRNLGINNIDGMTYGGKYFWKDKSLNVSTEHTAYSKTEMINNAVNKLGYRKETDKGLLLNYSVDPVDLTNDETSIDANSIDIVYSNVIKSCINLENGKNLYLNHICFFGTGCNSNTFGNECFVNTFGPQCSSNTFGNNCYNNILGPDCSDIKFASDKEATTKYTYYRNNHFGANCGFIIFTGTGTAGEYAQVQNYNFAQRLQGEPRAYLTIDGVRNRTYETKVAKNSTGKLKIYCEADLVQ